MNNSFDSSSVPLTGNPSGLAFTDCPIAQTPLQRIQFQSEFGRENVENLGSVQCVTEPNVCIDDGFRDNQNTDDDIQIIYSSIPSPSTPHISDCHRLDLSDKVKAPSASGSASAAASGSASAAASGSASAAASGSASAAASGSASASTSASASALCTQNAENGSKRKNEPGETRAFYLLDDLPDSDEDGNGGGGGDYEDESSDFDEPLERGCNEDHAAKRQKVDNDCKADGDTVKTNTEDFVSSHKTVPVEKHPDYFEVLPNGWISMQTTHSNGGRSWSWANPDYLEEDEEQLQRQQFSNVVPNNGTALPQARVVTAKENDETRRLTAEQLREYCSKLVQFKENKVLNKFPTWLARRKFEKKRRAEQKPSLPEGSALIMCPVRKSGDQGANRGPTEWIMNPTGKSSVCILHEYAQRVFKKSPVYALKTLKNAVNPYSVTISLNGVTYGKGRGSSRELAKMDAAKKALEMLIPGMNEKLAENSKITGRVEESKQNTEHSFFDDIKIEDPRVVEFSMKTAEPLPYAILLSCLQRNFGQSKGNIACRMKPVNYSKNEFTMSVGSHSATVMCLNKRDGKQKASQALLQILHPQIQYWGSLLRLYRNSIIKSFKEKKVEEKKITALLNRGEVTLMPNDATINKVMAAFSNLRSVKKETEPIGIFVPPEDEKVPTSSTSVLNSLEL